MPHLRRLSAVSFSAICLLSFIFAFSAVFVRPVRADSSEREFLSRLAAAGKKSPARIFALSLINLQNGREIFQIRSDEPVKPASILKIASSAAVLNHFGPLHQFETGFWGKLKSQGVLDELIVQGGGDPSLTIEDAWIAARKIKLSGIERVGILNFDASIFDEPNKRVGQRAYEAGASALAFNFNSLGIEICPSQPGSAAEVIADPWEVGVDFIGSIKTSAKRRGSSQFNVDEYRSAGQPLAFRLGGEITANSQCQTVYRSVQSPPEYFIRTFAGLLESVGIRVERIGGQVDSLSRSSRLYIHKSKPVTNVVRDLNHYSNNVIAEQLLYSLGWDQSRNRYSRDRGLEVISRYIADLGFDGNAFRLVDGSGLDHENRISAKAITSVLRRMWESPEISPDFLASLPLPGASGTLRERNFRIAPVVLRAKTGTLTGVSSLAGYIFNRKGGAYAFAMIQNGAPSKGSAVRFEDGLVQLIAEGIK